MLIQARRRGSDMAKDKALSSPGDSGAQAIDAFFARFNDGG